MMRAFSLIRNILVLVIISMMFAAVPLRSSSAQSVCPCGMPMGCLETDCLQAGQKIRSENDKGYDDVFDNNNGDAKDAGASFKHQLEFFEEWFLDFAKTHVIEAMRMMTEQLSAVAMKQVMVVGTFMDAKMQMQTQRLLQQLKFEAHKDYHPSENFCWFGSNIRSMHATEMYSRFQMMSLNATQMGRHLGNSDMAAATSVDHDKEARWNLFTSTYCDPHDNNWNTRNKSGLETACGTGGLGNPERVNIDIDYTRLIENPRSLDIGFAPSNDRTDVLSLSHNLYGNNVLTRSISSTSFGNEDYQTIYMALRSVAARRNVAQSSFNAIVGLKTYGTSDLDANNPNKTREFLGAIMTELGVPAAEVYELIGERPSHYAQLELLAKKIYQNPDFYANLYDKPANVARTSVALKAIELMLDRAIFESQIRREMATSVLLSTKMRKHFDAADSRLGGG